MIMKTLSMAVAAALMCLAASAGARAAEGTVIEPVERWADVFSGAEVKFHYTVRTAHALDGRLNWSLSVNRRTVEHGQLPLTARAEHAVEATVALKVPEVKEGVILESQLSVAAYADGDPSPLAVHAKKIWIFPRDPLANRSQWLNGLKITLFDPEGKTADVFEKAHIPFTFTKNTAALDELREGLLVIGEGTAWRDYRALGEAAVKAAARGLPVLCLAPGEGALVLPGTAGAELPSPASVTLRQEDIIRELDTRLDAAAWPPAGEIDARRMTIKSDRGQVVAETGQRLPFTASRTRQDGRDAGGEGWPWLEVRYPAGKGRLLVCGFAVIRQWEATPVPRYLLSELFLRLTAEKQLTSLPQKERKN
jgi:hypothetical protein